MRRAYWHFDFLAGLDGVEMVEAEGIKFAGVTSKAEAPFVKGKLGSRHHPQIAHFEYPEGGTPARTPKMTIPSPSMLHYRGGRRMIDRGAYPDMEAFYRDLGQAYKKVIHDLYAAGCRYLQLDDCSFAYLCDPAQRQMLQDRGDDPDRQGEIYAGMINAALEGRPERPRRHHACLPRQLPFDLHCVRRLRADRRSAVQPGQCRRLLPRMGFRSRRRLRAAAAAAEEQNGRARPDYLQDRCDRENDFVRRRIDEAAKYIPLEQLCLSPQCGFASTEEGNVLAEDEQWAKLRLVTELAGEVWGR